MNRRTGLLSILILFCLLLNVSVLSQERYLLGEEQQLQIVVYVLGEVGKPGEYIVSDKTDVLELLSRAGGETEFSNLHSVIITRNKTPFKSNMENATPPKEIEKEIIKFDVSKYLKTKNSPPAPLLKPGDVVYVTRNKWHTWKTVAAVLRDVAIVASTYFLYVRTFKSN